MLLDNVLASLKNGKVCTVFEIAEMLNEDIATIESAVEHLCRLKYFAKKDSNGCSGSCFRGCSAGCVSKKSSSLTCWTVTLKGEGYMERYINPDAVLKKTGIFFRLETQK